MPYYKKNNSIIRSDFDLPYPIVEEIEVGYDGNWYEKGHAPQKSKEQIEEELQNKYTSLIQSILDSEAQKLGYDNCLSVCSYVNTGVQKFDDEGMAFRTWRSSVWEKGYEILSEVKSGKIDIPTEDELIELLPKLIINYTI